ncbi:MAG: hypothetical protein H5U20_02755 [Rhodobacteraceae bacterium]|nr:hypothetical protein [Paracoccaceae bacterium]
MSAEVFAALVAFAFVSSITPGPNNAMLMASGANFGLRRTLPHLSGVVLGFTAMVLVLGAGLAPAGGAGGVAVVAAVFCAVTLPSVWIWVMAGQRLARALAVPGRLVWFNRGLAVLLVVSMLPVMFE